MTQPALLLWKCDCGWFGTAAQMTAAYACPQCGFFWTLSIAVPFAVLSRALTDACEVD